MLLVLPFKLIVSYSALEQLHHFALTMLGSTAC